MKKIFAWFRIFAIAEGISFLVLLLIAMPLKYLADQPVAVKIVGSLHGILFVVFMGLAYFVKDQYKKNLMWMAKAFLASLLPFGTFYMDRTWKKEETALQTS